MVMGVIGGEWVARNEYWSVLFVVGHVRTHPGRRRLRRDAQILSDSRLGSISHLKICISIH